MKTLRNILIWLALVAYVPALLVPALHVAKSANEATSFPWLDSMSARVDTKNHYALVQQRNVSSAKQLLQTTFVAIGLRGFYLSGTVLLFPNSGVALHNHPALSRMLCDRAPPASLFV